MQGSAQGCILPEPTDDLSLHGDGDDDEDDEDGDDRRPWTSEVSSQWMPRYLYICLVLNVAVGGRACSQFGGTVWYEEVVCCWVTATRPNREAMPGTVSD